MPLLRDELGRFLPSLGLPTEVILVDDGSSDGTLSFLLQWARDNAAVKLIILARNFGHQNAATAGLNAATGDAVVLMDADLQDPLDVIPKMIEKYCEGYDVVYAQRITREGESRFKRFTAWLFYRLMNTFVHSNLPPDTGDFRLISRRCLDAVTAMHETHRFSARHGGLGRISSGQRPLPSQAARGRLDQVFAVQDGALCCQRHHLVHAAFPLRISLWGGFCLALAGILFGLYSAYATLRYHDTVPGWTSLIIFTSVLGGAILISNGILGEYIGRCFEELKGRPLYIVAHRVNFTD